MSTINSKTKQSTYITTIYFALSLVIIFGLISCKKYLDAKPNQKLVLPSTLADCQALMDNYIIMNGNFPTTEHVADNYYLTFANWNTQQIDARNNYIWDAQANTFAGVWNTSYTKILFSNQVLETLKGIPVANDLTTWNTLKGEALFFRAYSLYTAAQLWTKQYSSTAATDPGIPIRLSPDISEVSVRGTVQQTYDRILQDLNEAVGLLPATAPTSIITKTRPYKAAAHAALARVYLAMGDYVNAGINANASLQLYSTLIDYNTPGAAGGNSYPQFNSEVIFDGYGNYPTLTPTVAKVDPILYASYQANDLRKIRFFRENTGANAGTYQFAGGYTQNQYSQFAGLATDEQYLIRAECYARAGNTNAAMSDLNALLRKRWVTGSYNDLTAASADDALAKILVERRKELIFRGLRWTDLRRLNMDPRFAVTLTRSLNGVTYTLPPSDIRYTLLIPEEVLRTSPIAQNER